MDERCIRPSVRFWPTALLPLALASGAQAAMQGSTGATSSGSANIVASIPAKAAVSGSEDIVLKVPGSVPGLPTLRDMCLRSNSLSRAYAISVEGSGPAGAPVLSNGAKTIDYSVEWAPPAGTFANGSTVLRLSAAESESQCSAKAGLARLVLAVDQDRLESAEPGAPYIGVLTLTIAPL